MSQLEDVVRQRMGIKRKKPSKWDRVDRELDEIEAKIEQLERDWRER